MAISVHLHGLEEEFKMKLRKICSATVFVGGKHEGCAVGLDHTLYGRVGHVMWCISFRIRYMDDGLNGFVHEGMNGDLAHALRESRVFDLLGFIEFGF